MKRAERQRLVAIIDDVREWSSAAAGVRYWAWHSALSWRAVLEPDEESLLAAVEEAASRIPSAQQLTKRSLFGPKGKLQSSAQAAADLAAAHAQFIDSGGATDLMKLRVSHWQRFEGDRERLSALMGKLAESRSLAAQVLHDAHHMPLTRQDLLPRKEVEALRSLVECVTRNEEAAHRIIDQSLCMAGTCVDAHASVVQLAALLDDPAIPALKRLRQLAQSMRSRLDVEQQAVARLAAQISKWPGQVDAARRSRENAARLVQEQGRKMLSLSERIRLGSTSYDLLPVDNECVKLLAALRMLRDGRLTAADEALLSRAEELATRFTPAAKSGLTSQGQCVEGRCDAAHALIPGANEVAPGIQAELSRLTTRVGVTEAELDQLADPSLGLAQHLSGESSPLELLDHGLMQRAHVGLPVITNAKRAARTAAARAKSAAETVRATDVAASLRAMELDVLRKASPDPVRVAPLSKAGLQSVWDVIKFDERHDLADLPGLGAGSAVSITQAALRLFEGVRDETPVRIDVKRRGKHTTDLLQALRAWDAARRFNPTEDEEALAKGLQRLLASHKPSRVLVLPPQSPTGGHPVRGMLEDALSRSAPAAEGDVWTEFLSRPADFFGMLTELGFVTEDEAKMHGDLPAEIVEAVRAKELKRDFLTASLRTYQGFGARFALVQRKVVIGDEMGLGKTVEALAVLAHLRSVGESHFLVVCPAAVVSNWIRETAKHTRLDAHRLHGPQWERAYAAKSWVRQGGVAVTTYDLLSWAQRYVEETEVAGAVFDEAHYIKNPSARRSQAAVTVLDKVPYGVLMTGTPLENSVQEFRNLIGYLRADLADSAPEYLPSKFRKHVAPVYLRRNQEDVLTELPELVEVEEWMGLSTADERVYREAVQAGHFMLMRRAAMLSPQSMKLSRLIEIVAEAEANDRRVIVFSYFRDVLETVASALPGAVFGPLTGSLAAVERQRLVDRFSAASGGAVLVAQITAGGVGLNIQAASVVVICEPQLKPTMEAQAVARAHRMGQVNSVQVHRLLTEDSVDERILEILEEKRRVFDEFARDSVIAKEAPDAVDVSDAELARIVIAAERERLFGQAEGAAD